MEWKRIPLEETATCNHLTLPLNPDLEPVLCSAVASWRSDQTCGCGAIHSELLRCNAHRISDLEKQVADTKKTVDGVVRYARTLNPDIRTDEECVLIAAGYRQHPRDEGDELWKSLNAQDVAVRN